MKKIALYLFAGLLLVSCNDTEKERKASLPDSSGNLNTLQVVVDEPLWNSEVGEAIREIFAQPIDGLPQEEPLFSISQMPTVAFSGFTQKSRIFLYIVQNEKEHFRAARDHYARPQAGFFVSAPTAAEIAALLRDNAPEMVAAYQQTEIVEKQRRTAKSTLNTTAVTDSLGISLKVPSAYRIAKLTGDFAWIRKDVRTGTLNLMLYQMPLDKFEDEQTRVHDLIRMRDSIGKTHIEGPVEGSYMVTEDAFSPFITETEVSGRFAYEARGTWEVKNDFMAGPFVNFIIQDPDNNRLLVAEGFTYAPSIAKRDYQFELESIIRSIRFQ